MNAPTAPRTLRTIALLALALPALTASRTQAQYYVYQELPLLPNGEKFKANAVGNGGHVVGEYDPSGDVKKAAWLWSPTAGIT